MLWMAFQRINILCPTKRGAVTITDSKLDGSVDEIGEIGDAVFEDIMYHLENSRAVLK
jgi:hypothetical protein